jgi:hypothetical protein
MKEDMNNVIYSINFCISEGQKNKSPHLSMYELIISPLI